MLPNRTGPSAAFALTSTPVPGVENTAPRGEFTLKKSFGSRFGADKAAGTPSQFISRLPVPNEPATLGLRVPRSVLKASTDGVIAAASGPDPKKVIGTAWASPVGHNTMRAVVRTDANTRARVLIFMTPSHVCARLFRQGCTAGLGPILLMQAGHFRPPE